MISFHSRGPRRVHAPTRWIPWLVLGLLSSAHAQDEPSIEMPEMEMEDHDESGRTVKELKLKKEKEVRAADGEPEAGKSILRVDLPDEERSRVLEETKGGAAVSPSLDPDNKDKFSGASTTHQGYLQDLVSLEDEDLPWQYVESAARHRQEIGMSPAAITVITREQINNTHCLDLPCVLRQVPEVDVREVLPMWAAVGARALTSDFGDKALLFLDGQAVNAEAWGLPQWYILPVQLEQLERIEIVRGPGSALYGANAHSVVISLTTKKRTEGNAEAFLGYGELGRWHAHGATGHEWRKWSANLSGGYDAADSKTVGTRQAREYAYTRLRVDRKGEASQSLFSASVERAEGEMGSVMQTSSHITTMNYRLFASHRSDLFQGHFGLMLADSDAPLQIPPMKFIPIPMSNLRANLDCLASTLDTSGQLLLKPSSSLLLIAGTDYRWAYLESPDNYLEFNNQHNWGVFLHAEQWIGSALLLTAGLRFDLNSITEATLSPRLAAVWRLYPDHVLRLAWGQAFRRPHLFNTAFHLTSLQMPQEADALNGKGFLRRSVGNPRVNNEVVTTLEGGYRGQLFGDRLTTEANVFYSRYRNTITLYSQVPENLDGDFLNNAVVQYRNTGAEADSVGGSLAFTFRVRDTLRLDINYTYRYTWYVASDSAISIRRGDQVMLDPPHLGNINSYFFLPWGFRLGLGLHGRSASEASVSTDLFGATERKTLDGLVLVHASLAWRKTFDTRWFEVGLKALDLLDERYRDWPVSIWSNGEERGGSLMGRMLVGILSGSL